MMNRVIASVYLYSHSSLSLEHEYEGLRVVRSYRDSYLDCNGFMT